jgi:glycosyltransferase involved in cell wall biosynthesis
VVPSITEAMGQVAVEALLARTPLVASRTGGLADMIRDGESGLHVPPGDAEALHAALSRLLAEPALADRLRAAGYRRGLDFTAARVVPQIEEIYRACVA